MRAVNVEGTQYASSAKGDYVAASGVLTFAPGSTRRYAQITVKGDSLRELDELVVIGTSNPTNATLNGFGVGFGGITDDD